MAKILVFNNDSDRMETYYRNEASKSNILWTTKRTMQTWNSQRYLYGGPIPVGFAFKRPYEGRTSEIRVNIMRELHLM